MTEQKSSITSVRILPVDKASLFRRLEFSTKIEFRSVNLDKQKEQWENGCGKPDRV
jgi:hypothetical protein